MNISENMYEAATRYRKEQGQRRYLGMSGIGGWCSRKIWYGFRGYQPKEIEGRTQMIFSLGSAVEAEVIKWLRGAGYQVDGQQDEFTALNGFFRGHCDGIIHGVEEQPMILEIKSASAARTKAFKTSGIPANSSEYYAQVQCYMGYSGLRKAVWVVMNKDTCEIYTELCEYNEEDFKKIETKAQNIISANTVPDRMCEQPGRECGWCDYYGHCWNSPYIQSVHTCGTCINCKFNGLMPVCLKYNKEIKHWGACCDAWEFIDTAPIDEVPF